MTLEDLQRRHLLADARAAVEALVAVPPQPARVVGPAALQRCGGRRGAQLGHEQVFGEGGDLDGVGHPAREVGFEGALVDVAFAVGFAGDFAHDVAGGEEDVEAVDDVLEAGFPGGRLVGLWC